MRESLHDFCIREGRQELLNEWVVATNLPFNPETISYGSTEKIWRQCAKGHHWQVTVNNRTSSHTDRPYCSGRAAWPGENGLASRRFSDLIKE